MKIRISRAQSRFFAGLFTNLAAAWFGAVLIAPAFSLAPSQILHYFLFGVTYSWLAIKMEEQSQ